MSAQTSFVQLPGRLKIEYVEQGRSDGIPVVCLHGLTDSWFSFTPVLPYLRDSLRVFAVSQRGHGNSDRPDTGFSPSDFADDVAAFLDAMEIKRAVIVGHSMGSFMAQRFALDYPQRTAGVVLIGSFRTLGGKPWAMQFLEDVSRLTDPVPPSFAREFQESTIKRPVPREFLETVVNESLKLPARVWKQALKQGHIDPDHSEELPSLTAPTLLVWGDQDALMDRAEQHFLAANIPNSRLLIYEGIGHAVHWEAPQRFARDLMEFIGRLGSAGAEQGFRKRA
jgi:pimeloyl-ACP methyl ester carboxylesterase